MDLDTLLRDTASVPGPAPAALAAGRARLDTAMVTSLRTVATVRRRRRALRVGITAAVAAAASVALIVAPTVGRDGRAPVAVASAAEAMRRAGAAAGAVRGDWRDAAYWRSVSTYRRGAGPAIRREIWLGHREPGVLRDPGVADAILPLEIARFSIGRTSVPWDGLYDLPTDPVALEREMRAALDYGDGKARDADAELFSAVGDLLRESPAPPKLRKALWEVAARVPGVTLVGPATDSAGRPGLAVERDGHGYVLDPDDGRLLEEAQAATAVPIAEAPSGSGWVATYLEQGPAKTAPAPG